MRACPTDSSPNVGGKRRAKRRRCPLVLDASALLALLRDEPGADNVRVVLPAALISSVNLAEVATFFTNGGMPIGDVSTMLAALRVRTFPFDDELAYASAALRPVTRHLGLSLGDRACLALAKRQASPVLTTDRAWEQLDVGVEVRLIRE